MTVAFIKYLTDGATAEPKQTTIYWYQTVPLTCMIFTEIGWFAFILSASFTWFPPASASGIPFLLMFLIP